MSPTDARRATEIRPGIRRLLAPNPGPMTYEGTNTYLIGQKEIMVVDPGPADARHLAALLSATRGARITHILVTHAHQDHSLGVAALKSASGAEVCAFGPASAGQRPVMRKLAEAGDLGGGEGVDTTFTPDRTLAEGDRVKNAETAVDVLHIPGHFAGHLGFALGDTMFCGDHVMDWSTSIVSPPDGHLGDFLESCQRLVTHAPALCLAGHGGPLHAPVERLEWLIAHRQNREAQLLDALSRTPQDVSSLVARVYHDLPEHLHPAAARNLLAHLIDLWERGQITVDPDMRKDAKFALLD